MEETNEIWEFNSDNIALNASNYLGSLGMEYVRNDQPSGGIFNGNRRVHMTDGIGVDARNFSDQ